MAWRHEFRVRPWDELGHWYGELTETHPEFGYLGDIVESIIGSPAAGLLAGTTSMHDLLITDVPVQPPPIECVIVRAPGSMHPPPPGCVLIEHLSHTGRNDSIERPAREAVALFWRFVQEKLGVDPATRVVPLNGVEALVRRRAAEIDAPTTALPTFGWTEDGARPHIEMARAGYAYVVVERGVEQSRQVTGDLDELLWWVFRDVTFDTACSFEVAHRREGEDFRRQL